MSYVRYGSCGSNVYLYENTWGSFTCSDCGEFKSEKKLAWHIFVKHHLRGHKVPLFAYFNLLNLPFAQEVQDWERSRYDKKPVGGA